MLDGSGRVHATSNCSFSTAGGCHEWIESLILESDDRNNI